MKHQHNEHFSREIRNQTKFETKFELWFHGHSWHMKKPQHDLAIFGSQDLDGYFFVDPHEFPMKPTRTNRNRTCSLPCSTTFHYYIIYKWYLNNTWTSCGNVACLSWSSFMKRHSLPLPLKNQLCPSWLKLTRCSWTVDVSATWWANTSHDQWWKWSCSPEIWMLANGILPFALMGMMSHGALWPYLFHSKLRENGIPALRSLMSDETISLM